MMATLLGMMFLGMSYLRRRHGRASRRGQRRLDPLPGRAAVFGGGRRPTTSSSSRRWASSSSPPTRASPTSRGSRRSWPATASSPASSPSAASGSPSTPGSWRSPWSRSSSCVAFGGDVDRLIGLYAIGVFTSFTLSQSGMVRHWFIERGPGWRRSALINGGRRGRDRGRGRVIVVIAKFDLGRLDRSSSSCRSWLR